MGEPLSPDHVFDFPMDELEPHPAYDFFMPGLLPRYAGNPKNNNGWIEADVPLLKELGDMADEPMVGPLDDEIAEPIVEAEDDDNSKGFEDKEEVWEVNEEWLMAPVTPPPMLVVHASSIYEVGGPSTAAVEGLSFPFLAAGLPVLLLVIEYVSDAEVADGITIEDIGLRVFAIEGQVQVMASQMVQAMDRLEQVGAHGEQGQYTGTQRDKVITRLGQEVQALQASMQQRDSQIQ
nr:hypothetical protein [Tanacetum cinerariifolium]